jgi:hypothetical protein
MIVTRYANRLASVQPLIERPRQSCTGSRTREINVWKMRMNGGETKAALCTVIAAPPTKAQEQ